MGKSKKSIIPIPTGSAQWESWPYRIGCPVWSCKAWGSEVYPPGTSADAILPWYSRAFPTVEGNSTFYSIPSPSIVERWCDATADGFRFSFKFPREISHDRRLVDCQEVMATWMSRLEILQRRERLGPTFLQLAPSFSSRHFDQLAQFLERLPREWPWSVEVRHPDWYDSGAWETRLDALLTELGIDRVIFDSRPLNELEANDETEQASQSRKPRLPLRTRAIGQRPMVRLIGRNRVEEVDSFWEEWAERIAGWIREGRQPWIFTHAPDDAFAPQLARSLHEKIRRRCPDLEGLPSWEQVRDGDTAADRIQEPSTQPRQLRWF